MLTREGRRFGVLFQNMFLEVPDNFEPCAADRALMETFMIRSVHKGDVFAKGRGRAERPFSSGTPFDRASETGGTQGCRAETGASIHRISPRRFDWRSDEVNAFEVASLDIWLLALCGGSGPLIVEFILPLIHELTPCV